MRISDWSSDVCSSDLGITSCGIRYSNIEPLHESSAGSPSTSVSRRPKANHASCGSWPQAMPMKLHSRSEEHTSELQSLMRTSYAVFCLKKKNNYKKKKKKRKITKTK